MRRSITIIGAAMVAAVGARAALAHITATPDTAAAGSYFATSFTVPHGCAGAATVAVRIKIPLGVTAVKPQMKPGWAVKIVTRPLDPPLRDEHGNSLTKTVDEVDWRGGPLPDDLYDSFGLLMKLPAQPGTTIYFPTVQECSTGVNRWIEIPAAGQKWHDLDTPAPFIRMTP